MILSIGFVFILSICTEASKVKCIVVISRWIVLVGNRVCSDTDNSFAFEALVSEIRKGNIILE
jgi:hypothetical protein